MKDITNQGIEKEKKLGSEEVQNKKYQELMQMEVLSRD